MVHFIRGDENRPQEELHDCERAGSCMAYVPAESAQVFVLILSTFWWIWILDQNCFMYCKHTSSGSFFSSLESMGAVEAEPTVHQCSCSYC